MTFRLPKKKKSSENLYNGLPQFDWNHVKMGNVLGRGSFGQVVEAQHQVNTLETKSVVVKILSDINGFEHEFVKEAKLLNQCNKSDNQYIVKFFGISPFPPAIMQELCSFDFKFFDDQTKTNSLLSFCQHVDKNYDFEGFVHVVDTLVKNIFNGLSCLHNIGIAHRDLKPANILVSNLMFHYLSTDAYMSCWQSKDPPILAKLTDFGESRSKMIQTYTILSSKVENLKRGTPVFNSPEISLSELQTRDYTLEDLKTADIWAFGLVIWYITNSDESYPFKQEITKQQTVSPLLSRKEILADILRNKIPPSLSHKYKKYNQNDWYCLQLLHSRLNNYNLQERMTSLNEIEQFFVDMDSVKIDKYFLKNSQSSSVESCDERIAKSYSDKDIMQPVEIQNDATNSCTFLCLKIIEKLSFIALQDISDIIPTLQDFTEDLIEHFPKKLNKFRDIGKCYDVLEAKKILTENKLVNSGDLTFSEEITTERNIYCLADGEELVDSLFEILKNGYIAVYTCTPISLTVFGLNKTLIVVDTHAVHENAGGNGNGLIMTFYSISYKLVIASFLEWLKKRLEMCCYKKPPTQSLALVLSGKNHLKIGTTNIPHRVLDEIWQKPKFANKSANSEAFHLNSAASVEFTMNKTDSSITETPETKSNSCDSLITGNNPHVVNAEVVSPDGTLYKGDIKTPVLSFGKKKLTWANIIGCLLNDFQEDMYCVAAPVNVEHNVSFLINTSKLKDPNDFKCDDMGSWKNNGVKKIHLIACFKDVLREYTVLRSYFKNASSADITKTTYKIEDTPDEKHSTVLLIYRFKGEQHKIESIKCHGNCKKYLDPYMRTFPSMLSCLKKSKDHPPKKSLNQIYNSLGGIKNIRSVGEAPRHPQQMYSARNSSKEANQSAMISEANEPWKDNLWNILQKARDNALPRFTRDCRIVNRNFFAVLALDKQLKDLEIFCCNPEKFTVLEFDPTFNIFTTELSLTVSTYRNLKLISRKTGKHPVFIGPLLLHQDKSWRAFSNYANTIITENPNLLGVIACGTDGERALVDGLKRHFRFAIMLRCFVHVRKNIESELMKRKTSAEGKKKIMEDIFGRQEGVVKFAGLVDSLSNEEFDEKLSVLQEQWNGYSDGDGLSFHGWFKKYQVHHFKESMLHYVRKNAGLGDPPVEYTNNDVEAGNLVIKQFLGFQKVDPGKFIEEIQKLIEQQYQDFELAMVNTGKYKVSNQFSHHSFQLDEWNALSRQQQDEKIKRFYDAPAVAKTTVSSNRTQVPPLRPQGMGSVEFSLVQQLNQVRTEITSVPLPIIDDILKDAKVLVLKEGAIIPNPLATDGSFLLAEKPNEFFSVKPSGDGFLCEKRCKNYKIDICCHIIAIAVKEEKLMPFVKWFKRKKPPTFTNIMLPGKKNGVGKKPHQKQRSKKSKEVPVQLVDMMKRNTKESFEIPKSNTQQLYTTSIPQQQSRQLFNDVGSQLSHQNLILTNTQQFQSISANRPISNSNQFSIYSRASMSNMIHQPIAFRSPSQPLPTLPRPFVSTPVRIHNNYCRPSAVQSPILQHNVPVPKRAILDSFSIKWVPGTTVSSCYGCQCDIANPPLEDIDNICIVHRTFREFRDPVTGLRTVSPRKQNVHFHPKVSCISSRFDDFVPSSLIIPQEYVVLLKPNIAEYLCREFNLSIPNINLP